MRKVQGLREVAPPLPSQSERPKVPGFWKSTVLITADSPIARPRLSRPSPLARVPPTGASEGMSGEVFTRRTPLRTLITAR